MSETSSAPPSPSLALPSVEKLSSTKPVPSAKKVRDHCPKGIKIHRLKKHLWPKPKQVGTHIWRSVEPTVPQFVILATLNQNRKPRNRPKFI